MDVAKWIPDNTIFLYVAGSHSYGLNTPESDIDLRGVSIPPKEYFIGLHDFDQYEGAAGEDTVIFNIRKFFVLALDANPNILEFLYAPEDCYRKITRPWMNLLENRSMFLSKKVKHTYGGYAFAQLKRIKSHKKWLLSPPDHEPIREEFSLSREVKMDGETFGYVTSVLEKGDPTEIRPEVMQVYHAERAYRNAKAQYDQYQGWLKNRNPKRAELESRYGYDTKHAMHVFRLIIQAEELLEKGVLQVRLEGDSRELCQSIKAGGFTYDQMLEAAEARMLNLNTLYENSPLPHQPNRKLANDALVHLIEGFLF